MLVRRFECPGLNGRPMACRLELRELDDGRWLAVAAEIAANPGASVTNAAEALATWAAFRCEVPPEDLVWVEHYDDLVSYADAGQTVDPPRWSVVIFDLAEGPGGAGYPPVGWHFVAADFRAATPDDWRAWGLPDPSAPTDAPAR
jgi:hypothetical protein